MAQGGYPTVKPFQGAGSTPGTTLVSGRGTKWLSALTGQAAAAYANGNTVDTKITIPNAARVAGGSGYIEAVSVSCKAGIPNNFDVYFFDADLASTITNNAALAFTQSDASKYIGCAHCNDVTNFGAGTMSFAQALNQGIPFVLGAGRTSIYAFMVIRGAATLLSTSDCQLLVQFRPD